MKKIIIVINLFIILSCAKTANISPPDYDLLVHDFLRVGEIEGTFLLFNPLNMELHYVYNKEYAFETAFEPGSIFKIVTSIAYFFKNQPFNYNSNRIFFVHPKDREALLKGINVKAKRKISSRFDSIIRGDYFPDGGMCPIGEVNLNSAMATSSNSYFLEIMTRFPFEDWYTFARSVGFGKKTGIELPVKTENADNNKKPELNDFYHKIESIREVEGDFIFNNELSRLMCAIGLGPDIKITPIQFAVFLASLFNGGKIMKPVFKGQNPVVITNYSLPKNIDLILSSLKETTLTGTGRGFEIPDASEIYSKSGSTMQHTTPYKPNGWFVGVVKAKNQYIGFVSFTPDRTSQTPKHIIASLLRSYIQNSIKSRD